MPLTSFASAAAEGHEDSKEIAPSGSQLSEETCDANTGILDFTPSAVHSFALKKTAVQVPGEIEVIVDITDNISGIEGSVSISFYNETYDKNVSG